ncbi:hypothetical protein GUJ93_ZPchr0006g43797 [Zizania palustris]|uniref:ornithine decarboxylase n=1 Tax=Zizania palustris TaxID=103762 RepID=A0A8J5W2J8_ZIZPA|nr:hypothetical protein GUJ93_ZPchr0006g43797 [Zizania palustris]
MLAVLVVMDREVLRFHRDAAVSRGGDVTGLVRTIVASTDPPAAAAFNVLDLGEVERLFAVWRRGLPGVRPYYAVKCNPNPALLGALAGLGAGFDCGSIAEMDAVLALGVAAERVVYANPCKLESHLVYAASIGVDITTFDSEEEVGKIKRCHPRCRLLLRIKAPDVDENAMLNLGTKYGAHREEVVPLLSAARRAGMSVVGVSFHVGSGVSRVGVYAAAIEAARVAFDSAVALGMQPMHVLDIGGGFKATSGSTFQEACDVIHAALARHFGDDTHGGLEVIAEPGRYFAETPFAVAARIFGKRTRREVREYWIDDGMFGTLCCVHLEKYVPRPVPVVSTPTPRSGDDVVDGKTTTTHPSTVFGPTLDSFDEVVRGYQLPELHIGDWLLFHDVGAYTTVFSSDFNGFSTSNMKTYLAPIRPN